MGPYSHYFLAAKLKQHFQPEDPGEYYWGAVIPDIRYLAKMRRDHTHLKQERLKELLGCYPHLKSFLLGYRVHCLIDQVEITQMINAAFPLNLINRLRRKDFAQPQMAMLAEMYYLQFVPVDGAGLAGSHNAVLDGLGITPEQTGVFFQGMQEYINLHSLDAILPAFQKTGMIENTRMEKYMRAYQAMRKQKALNAVLMLSVKNAGLDQKVMKHVLSAIRA